MAESYGDPGTRLTIFYPGETSESDPYKVFIIGAGKWPAIKFIEFTDRIIVVETEDGKLYRFCGLPYVIEIDV
jgi:hypothetical protein